MYGSNSGLLRYRSAPTSLLGQLCEDLIPAQVRTTSPETDTLLARYFSSDLGDVDEIHRDSKKHIPRPSGERSSELPPQRPPMVYQQQIQPQMVTSSMGMESEHHQMKDSHLIRHSSSPAGLFDQNSYGGMRGFRNESDQYPMTSWGESPLFSDTNGSNFSSGFKRHKTEPQDGELRNGLSHQFSLPKTSAEMAAIEKFLQFQDSVPCKIRAKRGCATHPRSIAERVRRTRISERMRKLQELVPNMDKQTNTADMLDLAVDYIKDLQKQVKTLSDDRVGCTCSSSKQTSYINPTI